VPGPYQRVTESDDEQVQNGHITQQVRPNDVYRCLGSKYFFYIFRSCFFLTN
jgi:hypothetical protein